MDHWVYENRTHERAIVHRGLTAVTAMTDGVSTLTLPTEMVVGMVPFRTAAWL
jgi:hypothetical protein